MVSKSQTCIIFLFLNYKHFFLPFPEPVLIHWKLAVSFHPNTYRSKIDAQHYKQPAEFWCSWWHFASCPWINHRGVTLGTSTMCFSRESSLIYFWQQWFLNTSVKNCYTVWRREIFFSALCLPPGKQHTLQPAVGPDNDCFNIQTSFPAYPDIIRVLDISSYAVRV